jgi:hypothetical protein
MFKSWFTVLLFIFCSFAAAFAADIPMLQWDANDDAEYYVVYWSTGPDSFSDENSIEVPADETFLELMPSPNNEEYYFTVKAFNECGNSSDFSEPVLSAHLPLAIYSGTTGKSSTSSAEKVSGSGGGAGCFIDTAAFEG